MLHLEIPPHQGLTLEHLILDFNGTIAVDGRLIPGVVEKILQLATLVKVHVITADTNLSAHSQLLGLPCVLHIIGTEEQDRAKLEYARNLGLNKVLAIGNGRNDSLLLNQAALGICLIQQEGASIQSLQGADMVCTHINDSLDLLLRPRRLTATLRN